MDIKHTILMITYNQEGYIREALDCLFRQGVLPYEVFILDDCSTDNTRDIVLEYKDKYPNIIKLIFHDNNLGIYQNLNYITDNVKVNGDIISFLSGDDLYKDSMLITFNKFINDNSLLPKDEKFLILTNQLFILKSGAVVKSINNYKLKDKNYLKLKLRNEIGNRYTGISRMLFDSMKPWNLELGLWADALHSFDLYVNCDKFYFINKSFPVYRLGSGVTSSEKKEIFSNSQIKVANYILNNRNEFLDNIDILYLNKMIASANLELNNSFLNKYNFIKLYLRSFIDVIYGDITFKGYLYESKVLLPYSIVKKLKKLIRGQ
jgi:glycosyltransferase involved in cell wall biosynthesis